ncbi:MULTISPECIES: Gfo/Idh/MocA family protein [Hydrogenophaga]|uniref:NAD binding oxidoreductase n=1 Tax=Hydrogenophaga intermedia TaxID=65786 RepID=A0A1L1PMP7_HYDIT|nr:MULTISPECIES: Gfo/Idh/MocA family oxidoreductase [Hydrogenophaga]AOS81128.1 oxidoreductase [Hydrogenophaga sp. PBC]TMU70470.1 Gfo/Idh/MocA family oxidoreductase [Hydrogenophaga intermedia]CDN90074.1 NAD binding oxidoreductase [Hydrogenophaga intermedia]
MTIEASGPAAQARRRIRLGMVGGGEGAFIGAVHRIAARLDDHYELIAGALSSTPEKALRSAAALGLARGYADYQTMAREEAARDDGIEAVAIVTPNDQHAPAAQAFLEAGIHVICDKPVTTTLADAERLRSLTRSSGRLFAVTYNYSGYPMVRHARRLVREGALGDIRLVQVEYPQDWLTEPLEFTGQKQAAWRTDPQRSGAGGCVGDIGTHAYQLAGFVSGLQPTQLCAELSTFVPGRALDDNVQVMLRYANGARGLLWASQVAPGNENALRLRVYGSRAGLEWQQEQPNHLRFTPFGEAPRTISRGTASANADAARVTRLPSGHPEGYLEGFATVYGEIAQAIHAAREGRPVPAEVDFPTIEDGIHGVAFIEAAVRSSAAGAVWVKV